MPQPTVSVIPPTFDAINKMAIEMKRNFDAAEKTGEDVPSLVRLIEDPDHLIKHSSDFCVTQMRAGGQFHPMMTFLSPRLIQVMAFDGGVPQQPVQQMMISTALRMLIAVSSVGAYWMASEIWLATQSDDPSVRRLQARQREDKREGVLVIAASASSYAVHAFETIRDKDGKTADLRNMYVPPGSMRFEKNPMLLNLFEGREKLRGAALEMLSKR